MKSKRILASVLSVALLLQLSPLNIWALTCGKRRRSAPYK